MGIFSKKSKDERQAKNAELIKSLTTNRDLYLKAIGDRLNYILMHPETAPIRPPYLYCDIVELLIANPKQFQPSAYNDVLQYADSIYKDVFTFEEETENFDELAAVFLEMFDVNGVAYKRCFEPAFFHIFKDKLNYIKWMKSSESNRNVNKIREYYVPYALASRAHFGDEDMFTANIIAVTMKMLKAMDPQAIYDEEMKKLEHMSGIYDVDEARLLKAEQRLETAEVTVGKASDILKVTEERVKAIDGITEDAVKKIKDLCETDVAAARAELSTIQESMERACREFAEAQQKIILYDKQQLLAEVFAEAEGKLREMQQSARTAVSAANLELMRLNRESGDVITKLENYMKDDERVQQLLADSGERAELFSKLERLTALSSTAIGQLEAGGALPAAETTAQPDVQEKTIVKKVRIPGGSPVMEEIEEEEEPDMGVNPLFDDSISFKDRFALAMERKEEMAKKGAIFHEMFDDVLTLVIENSNPYLIGPSGCGKTFMVAQIAKILGVDFIDIGYINEEYDILGFQTANGGYSKPNFYRCYKYGMIAFCDELDNGSSRATVKLNSFLSNSTEASYSFPGGETVRRHPNFRIIGAGNTAGNGADNNYNTREKIEESVQQRFTPVYVGYDNRVEKKILKDYPDWFTFITLFRKATDAWGKSNYSEAAGIITTRDAVRIKKYLDNGSMTPEKILNYEFIQTKEIGYLAFLASTMDKLLGKGSKAEALVKLFSAKVDELRAAAAE